MLLTKLGWNAFFASAFEAHADSRLEPARVVLEHRGGYVLLSKRGELKAEIAGNLRHTLRRTGDRPSVGDWVGARIFSHSNQARIHFLLPRLTCFSRRTAGKRTDEQVLAANIDVAFVVASLGQCLNLRSIERYLALAGESGAQPVVVLTKSDLCPNLSNCVAEVMSVVHRTPVQPVCTLNGHGMDGLQAYLLPARTVVVLGPSGVGKSTLINFWCGRRVQDTQSVREYDQKGRHTTTHRHLIQLPHGALIIDTPGMRELKLLESGDGIESTFDDVRQLAMKCRFSDCQHEKEPGCAVRSALETGQLDPGRIANYQKMQAEWKSFKTNPDKMVQTKAKRHVRATTRYCRNPGIKRGL